MCDFFPSLKKSVESDGGNFIVSENVKSERKLVVVRLLRGLAFVLVRFECFGATADGFRVFCCVPLGFVVVVFLGLGFRRVLGFYCPCPCGLPL